MARATVGRRIRMIGEPLVGAQRLQDLQQRQRPVLERDAGVVRLRALVVDRVVVDAGQRRRRRRAVVERRDVVAPPRLGARDVGRDRRGRRRSSRRGRAARARCGSRSSRACARRRPCSRRTSRRTRVAPGGPHAAVEEAVREFALAAAHRRLQRALAMRCDVGADPRLVLRRRRPRRRHDEAVHLGVGARWAAAASRNRESCG